MVVAVVLVVAAIALVVLACNIAMSILYMFVYGHIINPGQPNKHYDDHIQVAAPYSSIVCGIPLMYCAGWESSIIGVRMRSQ